jgi:hypothetical protein
MFFLFSNSKLTIFCPPEFCSKIIFLKLKTVNRCFDCLLPFLECPLLYLGCRLICLNPFPQIIQFGLYLLTRAYHPTPAYIVYTLVTILLCLKAA